MKKIAILLAVLTLATYATAKMFLKDEDSSSHTYGSPEPDTETKPETNTDS